MGNPPPAPAPVPPPAPKERPMGVTILAVLYGIEGLYCIFAAHLVDSVFGFITGTIDGMPLVGDIVETVNLCIMVVLIIIAIFYFLVALGMLKGQNWARRIGIIFAIIGLLNIPIGTIISIIILIYLFKPEIKEYFQK